MGNCNCGANFCSIFFAFLLLWNWIYMLIDTLLHQYFLAQAEQRELAIKWIENRSQIEFVLSITY